jgi:hypothetical protein
MTETDWLSSESPAKLFQFVRTKLSARKLQLLSCGCARLVWDVLTLHQREVVATVERYADGMIPATEYDPIVEQATRTLTTTYHTEQGPDLPHDQALSRVIHALVCTPVDEGAYAAMDWVVTSFTRRPATTERMATAQQARRGVCEVIREVVGNPFLERIIPGPEWVQSGGAVTPWMLRVGETARALAQSIQAHQAFDRMPILADAMEDDGCTDYDLLAHLRENRTHVRGCWALDLVLGKK